MGFQGRRPRGNRPPPPSRVRRPPPREVREDMRALYGADAGEIEEIAANRLIAEAREELRKRQHRSSSGTNVAK